MFLPGLIPAWFFLWDSLKNFYWVSRKNSFSNSIMEFSLDSSEIPLGISSFISPEILQWIPSFGISSAHSPWNPLGILSGLPSWILPGFCLSISRVRSEIPPGIISGSPLWKFAPGFLH